MIRGPATHLPKLPEALAGFQASTRHGVAVSHRSVAARVKTPSRSGMPA